jgi:hypothetical protein
VQNSNLRTEVHRLAPACTTAAREYRSQHALAYNPIVRPATRADGSGVVLLMEIESGPAKEQCSGAAQDGPMETTN